MTDSQLELDLKTALEEGKDLSTFALTLFDAMTSNNKARKQTALRFLQLHPDWSLWKKVFKPWFQQESKLPWEIVLSWMSLQKLLLSLNDRATLYHSLEKQKSLMTLSRFADWNIVYPELKDLRNQARFDIQRKILEVRDLLFEELRTWKSQQLREQEMKILTRLKKKFPNDPDILRELEKFKQNQAVEKLGIRLRKKRSQKIREIQFKEEITQVPIEWENALLEYAKKNPRDSYDLAIACCFMEDWVTALKLNNIAESNVQRDWLELEILLKLNRFIDVLQALYVIEMRWSHDGETFFATAYIRAQALYGLGQKTKALEVLESLLASRPLYRQGAELLHIWRGSQI
jgi:hypothetical protein